MPEYTLLGLSGYAQSGKDTAAGILARYGWQRVAFADKMKEMLYRINPHVEDERGYGLRLAEAVNTFGWDRVKMAYPEVRQLLQRLGTEAGRGVLGDDVWVHAALRELRDGGRYVITDVRFPNEAEAIKERGGHVLRIARPGATPINGHESETAMDEYPIDGLIVNDGSLDVFASRLAGALDRLGLWAEVAA